MARLGRWRATGTVLGLVLSSSLVGFATPALARTATVKISVDNRGPAGHNFEYVDFFPRRGVKIHSGDVLDFNWNTGSIDGLHTATLVPQGAAVPGLIAPDADDPGGQLQLNPAVLAPSDPTCGSAATPCVYDGTQLVNSGAIANAGGGDFFVKVAPKLSHGKSAVVNFLCEIHEGMRGSVTVVPRSEETTELEDVREMAAEQLEEDTEDARRAEAAANHSAVKLNPDGKSHTVTLIAGTATQFVEVAEMLPRRVTIHPGDTVTWVTKTLQDPHTVTFPLGKGSDGVDPLNNVCEGTPDTAAVAGPPSCASPTAFEVHLIPQPLGATTITSPTTVGSSGIIGNPLTTPSDRFSFHFPNAGTFDYMCRIHDHMIGTIVAR